MRLVLLIAILMLGLLVSSAPAQTAVITGPDAFLRGTPGETGAVVDTLAIGSKVHVIKKTGDWYLVQSFPFVGWIHGSLMRVEEHATAVTKPASLATAGQSKPSEPSRDEPVSAPVPVPAARVYKRGPRGGCYYVKDGGKKVYVAHRLCGEPDLGNVK